MKLYNTLTGKKEEFLPEKNINIYVCGITPYDYIHIGNARPTVFWDVVCKYFEYLGHTVRLVQNFTDIDEKIIEKAEKENKIFSQIADKFIWAYYEDIIKLMVSDGKEYYRVTDNLDQIIDMISVLIEKKYAYVTPTGVYFRVNKIKEFGKLSKRKLEDMQDSCGHRIDVDVNKENPMDFALWKTTETHFHSPWGHGIPGWHIECSAMIHKYFGETVDIHGGGCDLIFPHHENEIAQTEAAYGYAPAKIWMHNGFVTLPYEKMEQKLSKSLGNCLPLREYLKEYGGGVIRLFLLSAHYRSELGFRVDELNKARTALSSLKNTYEFLIEHLNKVLYEEGLQDESVSYYEKLFKDAMDDDFNTPAALAVINGFSTYINSKLSGGYTVSSRSVIQSYYDLFTTMLGILGLYFEKGSYDEFSKEDLIKLITDVRDSVRSKKDFETSDLIRDRMAELNIILEDTKNGTRVKYNYYY